MRRWLFLLFFFATFAHAAEERPYRFGLELELTPEHFAKFVDFFDVGALQSDPALVQKAQSLPPTFYNDYLRDSPRALESLPPALREELTRGLTLRSLVQKEEKPLEIRATKLDLGSAAPAPRGLLGADGKPLGAASPASTLLGAKLAAPKAPEEFSGLAQKSENGVLRPERFDWEELYRRWAALDPAVKERAVQWEHLGPNRKAELVIHLLGSRREFDELKPRADLPPAIRRTLDRLQWSGDGHGVIEFQHKESLWILHEDDLLRDIEALSRWAGVERKVFFPDDSKVEGVSLHYHVSRDGDNFNPALKEYNHYLLAERLHAGVVADLKKTDFGFDQDLDSRGLVRTIEHDHFEQRAHHGPLREEVSFLMGFLRDRPESVGRLRERTRALLTPEVLRRILRYDLGYFPVFQDLWTPEEMAVARNFETRYRKLQAREGSPDLWRRIPALVRSDKPELRKIAKDTLAYRTWPEWLFADLPRLLRDPRVDHELLQSGLRVQSRNPRERGERLSAELFAAARKESPGLRGRFYEVLSVMPWTEETLRGVEEVLLHDPMQSLARESLFNAWATYAPTDARGFLPRYAAKFRGVERAEVFRTAISARSNVDDSFWRPAHEWLRQEGRSQVATTRRILWALSSQDYPHAFAADLITLLQEIEPRAVYRFLQARPENAAAWRFSLAYHKDEGMLGSVARKLDDQNRAFLSSSGQEYLLQVAKEGAEEDARYALERLYRQRSGRPLGPQLEAFSIGFWKEDRAGFRELISNPEVLKGKGAEGVWEALLGAAERGEITLPAERPRSVPGTLAFRYAGLPDGPNLPGCAGEFARFKDSP